MLSMGTYPDTSLALARTKHQEARKLLAADTDPSTQRQAEVMARADTFEALAYEFMAQSSASPSTLQTTKRRLETHVFPYLRNRNINTITSLELKKILMRVEARGTIETARRIRTNCSQVFRYAIGSGQCENDPAEPLKDVLKKTDAKNFAFVRGEDAIGQLMRAIDGYEGHAVTNAAFKLAPLLMVRPGELRAATWDEFDLDAAMWTIKVERTKTKKVPHFVPLPSQAVEVLRELHQLTGHRKYVFPSPRTYDRPMSNNCITSALRRIGYSKEHQHWHGFRHLASTQLNEMGFPHLHIERQLHHVQRDRIAGTYNHAEYLEARRAMLQCWADYLFALRDGEKPFPSPLPKPVPTST